MADGVLIVVGGTLLLTPGFITDIFGLLLLIPPTRAIARRLMRPLLMRRFRIVGFPGRTGARQPYDFDGTAEEAPADEPRH